MYFKYSRQGGPVRGIRKQEEKSRQEFVMKAVEQGIQLVQLPCPEFTLYGPKRWGHTREQFDNPFFREHCRKILSPVLTQMKAYMGPESREQGLCWRYPHMTVTQRIQLILRPGQAHTCTQISPAGPCICSCAGRKTNQTALL
ncbi:MAG: hypothetical protein SO250_17765 [Enterocloster clostridioformis]|nr:hypothetical protein [Enterocloster clostridioformis]MDY4765847.1 hypothetical protein [Enterocloster clostridioformis]